MGAIRQILEALDKAEGQVEVDLHPKKSVVDILTLMVMEAVAKGLLG